MCPAWAEGGQGQSEPKALLQLAAVGGVQPIRVLPAAARSQSCSAPRVRRIQPRWRLQPGWHLEQRAVPTCSLGLLLMLGTLTGHAPRAPRAHSPGTPGTLPWHTHHAQAQEALESCWACPDVDGEEELQGCFAFLQLHPRCAPEDSLQDHWHILLEEGGHLPRDGGGGVISGHSDPPQGGGQVAEGHCPSWGCASCSASNKPEGFSGPRCWWSGGSERQGTGCDPTEGLLGLPRGRAVPTPCLFSAPSLPCSPARSC